jgi:hypothetical protein
LRGSGARFIAADVPDANDLTGGILALVAQQEREAISRRTREALAAAKRRGTRLGNPNGADAEIDEAGICPGPVITVQLMLNIALGSDNDARQYLDAYRSAAKASAAILSQGR